MRDLVVKEAEFVTGHARLINEQVGDLLGVDDGLAGLIQSTVHLLVVQIVLDAINSVANTEPRIDDTFDNCQLFLVRILRGRVMERGDRNKDTADDLFLSHKVLHGDAKHQITVEVDLVENALEALALKLVEKVGVLRLVGQVNL